MSDRPQLTLYGKAGCSLCDKAKELVLRVQADIPLELREVDITGDPELFSRYRYVIPVLAIDGREAFVSKVSELRLRQVLARR